MQLSDTLKHSTETLILLAEARDLYNPSNQYVVQFENRVEHEAAAGYIKICVNYESGTKKEIELGPFYTDEAAIAGLRGTMRLMIDHYNQDLHRESSRIVFYPGWLL